MVIVTFSYPDVKYLWDNPRWYSGRAWWRDGDAFDGGMFDKPVTLRNGNVRYLFIDMEASLRSLNAFLQHLEGTSYGNN